MTALQFNLHLLERGLSLFEEAKDDALGEVTLVLIVIHFQYLLKGQGVDRVTEVRKARRSVLRLRLTSQQVSR